MLEERADLIVTVYHMDLLAVLEVAVDLEVWVEVLEGGRQAREADEGGGALDVDVEAAVDDRLELEADVAEVGQVLSVGDGVASTSNTEPKFWP